MPRVMAARLVGRNFGIIFRRLYTKIQQLTVHVREWSQSAVCLMTPCSVPEIFAIRSRSSWTFDVFGPHFVGVDKFLTKFYKFGSPSKFGDNRQSDLGDKAPKKKTNDIRKTEWLAKPASIATRMGNCQRASTPSRYVTSHLGQLSLPSLPVR